MTVDFVFAAGGQNQALNDQLKKHAELLSRWHLLVLRGTMIS